ncbi:hypothetical protein P7K49_031125 [Saguinus oedipus]|uniref:Uncharacterized protein n=1 Tax=Saguinus oedipus TaxID=9490 RepID=A0ABQ9U496_SAGOE|nr:hypothetical protein P7K49_031125 [Saguinus oedipus]
MEIQALPATHYRPCWDAAGIDDHLSYQAQEPNVECFFKGYGKILDVDLKNGYCFVESDDLLRSRNCQVTALDAVDTVIEAAEQEPGPEAAWKIQNNDNARKHKSRREMEQEPGGRQGPGEEEESPPESEPEQEQTGQPEPEELQGQEEGQEEKQGGEPQPQSQPKQEQQGGQQKKEKGRH